MKILFLLLFTINCSAKCLSEKIVHDISIVINKVEGDLNTNWPYGIRKYGYLSYYERKQRNEIICKNTIRNNYQRWIKSGQKEPFFLHLSKRYCPPSVDIVGHTNWVNNYRFFAKKYHVLF